MKRLLALLLVAVMLLCCGCTDKSTPETTKPAEAVASGQAPAGESQPVPDYVASYPDPLEQLPTDENGEPVYVIPASPADPGLSSNPTGATNPVAPVRPSGSAIRVLTDDSQYTPFRLPQAKYTRLKAEPMTEFQPMPGLGAVYPYAAAPIFSRGDEDGWAFLYGHHMGLTDKSGRLLTDGIYVRVAPVEYVEYDNDNYRSLPLPYWAVTQVENIQTYTAGEGENTWTYTDGDLLYGLVSMDGSFATPVEYKSLNGQSDCVIASRDWDDPWDFDVFDLHGKLLFSGKDIPKRSADGFDLSYGEGLFVATWYRWGNEEEWSECRYLDETGSEVLGPYSVGNAFHDGLACVSTDGGKTYGYIDKTGAWVIEPRFTDAGGFSDGRAIHEENEISFVIDKTGREIFRTEPGTHLDLRGYGYQGNRWADEKDTQIFYDFSGNELFRSEGIWYSSLGGELLTCSDGDNVQIFSIRAPEQVFSAPGSYATPAYALLDGKPVRGYEVVHWDREQYTFVTQDLSQSWVLDAPAPVNQDYMGYRELVDPVTGKEIKLAADRKKTYVFDETDKLLGTCPKNLSPSVVDGMLYTVTDFACTYTDPDGNVVFCYPLTTVMDD